jgi:hypothetical protein
MVEETREDFIVVPDPVAPASRHFPSQGPQPAPVGG